tara:strand:- start:48 stop:653 length:606 start_codon:yes stop_codon:yes gene_type:complete
MSWWSLATTEPKRKNKFYVSFGTGGKLYSVSNVSKPSVTVEAKEYRLINHFYKYPGIPKWEQISIKFVDAKIWGSGKSIIAGEEVKTTIAKATSKTLWEMLLASGYVTPSGAGSANKELSRVVSPEKAAMIDLSFGSSTSPTDGSMFRIHQVNAAGESTEIWTLYNPLITKISWGDLDYSSDDLVEYTLDVAYDWAELTEE